MLACPWISNTKQFSNNEFFPIAGGNVTFPTADGTANPNTTNRWCW